MDGPSLNRSGSLLFIGVVEYAFCLVLSEIYYPGYSVSINAISDLGATCSSGVCKFVQPSSLIFNSSIVLLGILLLLSSYYLRRGSGTKALPFFFILAGIGCLGVGIFNESYGVVHSLFSALTFISIGISALLVFKVAKPPFSYFSIIAGLVTLGATVLYIGGVYLGLGNGGMERMIVYPVLLGVIGLAGYLMNDRALP